MAFLIPGLSYQNISFSVADDHMDSDHFPIQIHLTSHSKTEYTTYRTTLLIWQN